MSHRDAREEGFTLVELMVAVALFSIIAVSFYAVMFSGVRGAEATQAGVDVSAEARLGLNRMIRDVREASTLAVSTGEVQLTASKFTIHVNFDRDASATEAGEVETFTFDPLSQNITLTVDGVTEVLVEGVDQIGAQDMFSFSSNHLELDQNGDGVADCGEVDDPPLGISGGDGDGLCDDGELEFLTNVDFTFSVTSGEGDAERSEEFFAQAQLRNRR